MKETNNKVIDLIDDEESHCLRLTITPEATGVQLDCVDHWDNEINLLFDAKLFKAFCLRALEHIEAKAQMKNYCGEVEVKP